MNKDNPEIRSIIPEVIKIRHYLHMYPELSGKEYKTSQYIKNTMDDIGIPAKIVGTTGVVASIIENKLYSTIAIRAEIDALPIIEQTDAEYCSKNLGIMHACGHDGIAATALGLAKLLNKHKEDLKCNVKFIFEPAEEIGMGTKKLIAEKVLENPKVDKIVIFHFTNSQTFGMEIQSGISTATIGRISISIRGKSSHWGERENGIDAISVSAKVISAIDEINNTYQSELPFVIGIGMIHGGVKNNIMADSVELNGSLRAFYNEEFYSIYKHLQSVIKLISEETGSKITVSLLSQIPPIINSPELVIKGIHAGKEVFSDSCAIANKPYLAGDNASYYFQLTEGLRIVFFAKKDMGKNYPLHNPKFDFSEDIFSYAIATLYNLVVSLY